jgi:hypothetical protein
MTFLSFGLQYPIGRWARLIVEVGHFSVMKDSKGDLNLSFSPQGGNNIICYVPNHVLKFFAQILGHENMSESWCMWCQSQPCKLNSLNRSFPPWTIEFLKRQKDNIVKEKLKEPKAIYGVVDYPVWDFIKSSDFIFPILHVEIFLANNALDNFYAWVEDHVEAASAEEKMCRNKIILTDTELMKATKNIEVWKESGCRELISSLVRLSGKQMHQYQG